MALATLGRLRRKFNSKAFVLNNLIEQLRRKADLQRDQVTDAVAALVDSEVAPETKADFLTALALKGETADEICSFAHELRARSVAPPLDPATRAGQIIDVCGTGGDHLNTFNISTTAAILVASAGITVAKHGNRAITSRSGSADVLEALGIPIDLSPEQAAISLRDQNFAFLFAPMYHPAFKQIAPARKLCAERGQKTIFNFLGPLLNPARPTAQLIGVPGAHLCEPLARVLQSIGVRRGMLVCGQAGDAWLDELSIMGQNHIAEFYQDNGFTVSVNGFEGFSFQACSLRDLAGGDRHHNAEIARRILLGEDRGPKRDAVLLNAAAALVVADKAGSVLEGWEQAEELLDNGHGAAKLLQLSRG
jgi:anthranilate phosphoribosyltransferase